MYTVTNAKQRDGNFNKNASDIINIITSSQFVPHRNVCDTAKPPTGALRHSSTHLDI
jgi:hypothetical protein